jgi:hypothetical protein
MELPSLVSVLTIIRFGFCGTTDGFCGDQKVKRPSCSVGSTKVNRVIGYYEGWSLSERSCNGMAPENIPYGVYTHIKSVPPLNFLLVVKLIYLVLHLRQLIRSHLK